MKHALGAPRRDAGHREQARRGQPVQRALQGPRVRTPPRDARASCAPKPRLVAQQRHERIELGHAVIGIGQQLTGALRPSRLSMNCSVAAAGAISSRPPKITCKGGKRRRLAQHVMRGHGDEQLARRKRRGVGIHDGSIDDAQPAIGKPRPT